MEELSLLDGLFVIASDGNNVVLKQRTSVVSKNDGTISDGYNSSYYSNYKGALLAIVRDCAFGCSDINDVLKRIDDLEEDIFLLPDVFEKMRK